MKQLIITPKNYYVIDEEKLSSLPSDNELKELEVLYTRLTGKSPFADGRKSGNSNYTKPKKRKK